MNTELPKKRLFNSRKRLLSALMLPLMSGMANAECTTGDFSAAEESVLGAYIAYYGRPADPAGLSFWAGELQNNGGDLSGIIEAFGNSPEFEERFGSLEARELVDNLFVQLFGRSADEAGLNFWVEQYENGLSLQAISLEILGGARNDDQTIINNRLSVSQHYVAELDGKTVITAPSGNDLADLIAGVTVDTATSSSACSSVDTLIAQATTGGGTGPGTASYVAENKELKGDFTESVTLESGEIYGIDGEVNFLEGTTLTIPAGTKLFGMSGSSYLAINRGAKIMAQGTRDNPIVFTSAEDIVGTAGQNDQGQWGGLTILGQSTNNKGERTYEAGTQKYGPKDGVTIEDDNSGVLEYVMIKYSGFEVEVDKELNGLSLGSVGSGTTLNNIAIIGSADDGIELWGGTVNVNNLYVYNAGDDSLDTDQGYTGTLDNVLVQQVVVDDEIDSRAIEADSFDEIEAGDPIAMPTLRNATLDTIGRAIRLREGTGYVFDNVQVNVKQSSADPASESYNQDIAAIRISDDVTFNGANIIVLDGGLGIKNEAVELSVSDSAAGDITANGLIANGKGLYRDQATADYFAALTNVHATVGISGDMVDEGLLDSDGSAFQAEVASDNILAGADKAQFDWAIQSSEDKPVEFLEGDITQDMTLSNANQYAINGEVNVIAPATLTIEAGTTLFGVTGSSYLAVNRGAKIIADGTAAQPIVFTSAQDVAGQNTGDEQGQWGGLTILGQSTNNRGERTYEAGTQKYGPMDGVTIEDDNSGILRYVVVKYSGFEVEKDKELNGISLGSVGSGTIIENIASIGSADDGIEFWGGTVSVNGLYIYNAGDDSLDTDQGYTGTMENVFVEQNIVDDEVDSRVIEADGLNETDVAELMSKPVLVNAILNAKGRAIRLREGTGYVFNNVQVTITDSTDADTAAIRISNQNTFDQAQIETAGAGLAIKNTVNASAIYRDADTEAYFNGLSNVFVDDNTTLDVTEYDRSWIPGWTK
ncbi:MAG: DUF4214 domain-containing protein [Pseudomonadales bacterium]|nr:DUF4214 domain-containing protein [Pseudomonadales bacterium]